MPAIRGRELIELRMDERTVVALRIVEKDELPVARKLVGDASRRLQIRDVPAREPADQRRKDSLEHPTVSLNSCHPELVEGRLRLMKMKPSHSATAASLSGYSVPVEAGNFHHVARDLQLSVERVRPGVIRALDRSRKVSRSFAAETRAAVAADVVEGMHRAAGVARDDQTFSGTLDREKIAARAAAILRARRRATRERKIRSCSFGKDVGRDVPHGGQRLGAGADARPCKCFHCGLAHFLRAVTESAVTPLKGDGMEQPLPREYDVIVLGLGALGSAAAYWSAKRGARVLGLEQFEFGHARGSSHDRSRIIRLSYFTPAYVQMAKEAYRAWASLEEDAGERLVVKTGGLDIGPRGSSVQNVRARQLDARLRRSVRGARCGRDS